MTLYLAIRKSLGRVYRRWYRPVRTRFYGWRWKSSVHPTCTLARDTEIHQSRLDEYAAVAYCGSVRRSRVGRFSSVGRYTKVADADIGAFCSISWDCTIGAEAHPFSHLTSHVFPWAAGLGKPLVPRGLRPWPGTVERVILGNDVWLGANAVVLSGVTVGDGAVIAAGAVVTKDVAPYTIVAGVPARLLRERFAPSMSARLLALRWWTLPDDVIRRHVHLFQVPLTEAVLDELERLCAFSRTA